MTNNGNGDERGLPAMPLDEATQKQMGLLEPPIKGEVIRRSDLDFGRQLSVPEGLEFQWKTQGTHDQNMEGMRQQLLGAVGFEVMRKVISNPQARLIAIPYNINSLRHTFDIRVSFWELRPEAEGRWALGMRFIEIADSGRAGG